MTRVIGFQIIFVAGNGGVDSNENVVFCFKQLLAIKYMCYF